MVCSNILNILFITKLLVHKSQLTIQIELFRFSTQRNDACQHESTFIMSKIVLSSKGKILHSSIWNLVIWVVLASEPSDHILPDFGFKCNIFVTKGNFHMLPHCAIMHCAYYVRQMYQFSSPIPCREPLANTYLIGYRFHWRVALHRVRITWVEESCSKKGDNQWASSLPSICKEWNH